MAVIRHLEQATLAAASPEQGTIRSRQPVEPEQGYLPLDSPHAEALTPPLPSLPPEESHEEAPQGEGQHDEEALAAALAVFLQQDPMTGFTASTSSGFSRRSAGVETLTFSAESRPTQVTQALVSTREDRPLLPDVPSLAFETLQARLKLRQGGFADLAGQASQAEHQTPVTTRAAETVTARPLPVLPPALIAALGGDLPKGEGYESKGMQVPTLTTMHQARGPEYQWAPAKLADNQSQWGQQLVDVLRDKVEMQVNHQIKQAHIRLDPPELGRLELTVRMEGDKLSVQLNAANPAVRDALIQSMERLRMSLAPHHAGGVEVNVGQGGEQERRQAWTQDEVLAGRRDWADEPSPTDTQGRDWLNTLV